MAQFFGDERCTAAILEFLATTEVGLRGRKARQIAGDEDNRGERTGEDEDEEDDDDDEDEDEDDEEAPSEGWEGLSEDEGG
jgi:phosphopantothenoylcysteine synthetase/decarboxylase